MSLFADTEFASSDAVFMFGNYSKVAQFIHDCQTWDIQNSQTTGVNYTLRYFMTLSDIRMGPFKSALQSLSIPRPEQVYTTSALKDFDPTTNVFASQYKDLMAKYFPASDPSNLDSFAGFVLGNFLQQILAQLRDNDLAKFTDVIYSYSDFQIGNDFHVGPLIDVADSISFVKKRALLDEEAAEAAAVVAEVQQTTTISCNQGLRSVFFYSFGANMTLVDLNLANSYASCGAIIIIPPQYIESYECASHAFINYTAQIVDLLANPSYIRAVRFFCVYFFIFF
jgi:hypothetical protein